MPTLSDAIVLATIQHQGQTLRNGEPYILHPLTVMLGVSGELERQVAVLHDVVEDTTMTLDTLRSLGYCSTVVLAIDLLTRRKLETYDTYIARMIEAAKHSPHGRIAVQVKRRDLQHNLDVLRIPHGEFTDKDKEHVARYQHAWWTIEQIHPSVTIQDVG